MITMACSKWLSAECDFINILCSHQVPEFLCCYCWCCCLGWHGRGCVAVPCTNLLISEGTVVCCSIFCSKICQWFLLWFSHILSYLHKSWLDIPHPPFLHCSILHLSICIHTMFVMRLSWSARWFFFCINLPSCSRLACFSYPNCVCFHLCISSKE